MKWMSEQQIYWVDPPLGGRLAVVTRPRSQKHLAALKAAGIDMLISMLEPEEAVDVGLADEAAWCAQAGLEFLNVPISDHGVPSSFDVIESVMPELAERLRDGRGIAAHCYAGLGRSPLLIASVLIHHGLTDGKAIKAVSLARETWVPEMDSQHRWLLEFALRCREREAGPAQ
ncbi:MAG: hypothetical protein AB7L90_21220 [Hyphomicrobiaceae bacterium]